MSDEKGKALLKIRTFASDMEAERQKTGQPAPEQITVPVSNKTVHVAPRAKAATSIPTPIPTPNPVPVPSASAPTLKGPAIVATKLGASPAANVAPEKKVTVRAKKRVDLKTPVNASGGTIITDGRKAEFDFFSQLSASIQKWFHSITTPKKSAPKYTIADTERRKGVIQKATTKTGTIFTADSETLREEIRRRRQAPVVDSTDPDITWSPNTEVGYALLEAPETSVPAAVTVTFRQPSTPATLPKVEAPLPPPQKTFIPPPVIIEPSVPNTPPVPLETPEYRSQPQVFVPPTAPEEPAGVLPSEAPTPTVHTQYIEEELPIEEDEYFEHTLIPYEEVSPFKVRSFKDLVRLNTNFLTVGVTVLIGAILIIMVVVKISVGMLTEKELELAVTPAEALVSNDPVVDLVIPDTTMESLLTALNNRPLENSIEEIRLVDATGVPIPTLVILEAVGFISNQNLNRSISEVHIVTLAGQRGIVLKVTDATTVFGGLLSSEATLISDVGSVLNVSEPPEGLRFSDRTFGNNDFRVLELGGKISFAYGFIARDTVLITSNESVIVGLLGITQ